MNHSLRESIPLLTCLVLLPLQAGGEANLPWQEYDQLVQTRMTPAAAGAGLFGEQISLYNTALSFSATDISLSGNHDLPVALTRTFSVKSRKPDAPRDLPFGTWDLDVPRIEGVFADLP